MFTGRITHLMPTRQDLRDSLWPTVRGTALGAFFGLLPGTGPALSSFAAYMVEKKLARDPSRFGSGAIEGVAAPEAANNAAAQTAFIPTLTLGIPGSAVMTLMVGAMIMQGITPGPQVMTAQPELFWGIVASMWIGNLMLVVLNLPLVGIWVRLLRVPYRWLFPSIVMFCCIGNYSVSNNPVDVYLCAAVGVLGYVLAQARVRARAAAPRLRARAADRGVPAARDAPLARRSDGVLHAPDQPRVHGRHGGDPGHHDRAGPARAARRSALRAACRRIARCVDSCVRRHTWRPTCPSIRS